MGRTYSQTKPRKNLFITYETTVWLYPQSDIDAALATTTYPHVYDGDSITFPDMTSLAGAYFDIYSQTALSNPGGSNPGYTVGVGTLLQDMGRELRLSLTGGKVVVVWRLVKQLTPQRNPPLATGVFGQSPDNTVGFVPTFLSFGRVPLIYNDILDDVNVIRTG